MITVLVFLPLLAFLAVGLGGHRLGRPGSVLLCTGAVGLSFLLALALFLGQVLPGRVLSVPLLAWLRVGVLEAHWGFWLDPLSGTMLVVVTSISSLVHLYSVEYMAEDPHLPRFMSYLSLFTFCMLMLVSADNFLQLFFGWEGVGLSSYLLISFWHTRLQANKAALKALLVNRVGDLGLLLALAVLFDRCQSLDFAVVFALAPSLAAQPYLFLGWPLDCPTLVGLGLLLAAVGKSAQLGLHTWLPDAMEGPTPVSALIHAATMVTAGVFLLVRCSPLLERSPALLGAISLLGGLTAFFAASVAVVQNDLKRVVAYSTCSQLGYMVLCCGLSAYGAAMFHLLNHAFFKALLFLAAGSVIHALADEQDLRRMGGLARLLPFTYSAMLVGSLSLMGFPFLTGFYSKDLILEVARAGYSWQGRLVYWLGTLSVCLTAFYSVRLLYLAFLAPTNGYRGALRGAHEPRSWMLVPLAVLSVCSVLVGYLLRDMLVGLGSGFWNGAFYVRPARLAPLLESEFLPAPLKLLPVLLSLLWAGVALYLYRRQAAALLALKTLPRGLELYRYLNQRWLWDLVYNHYLVRSLLGVGYRITFRLLDRGLLSWFGPSGLAWRVGRLLVSGRRLQSGLLYHYLLLMVGGLLALLGLLLLSGLPLAPAPAAKLALFLLPLLFFFDPL